MGLVIFSRSSGHDDHKTSVESEALQTLRLFLRLT